SGSGGVRQNLSSVPRVAGKGRWHLRSSGLEAGQSGRRGVEVWRQRRRDLQDHQGRRETLRRDGTVGQETHRPRDLAHGEFPARSRTESKRQEIAPTVTSTSAAQVASWTTVLRDLAAEPSCS